MEFVGAIDWTENEKIITCNTLTRKLYSLQNDKQVDDFILMQFTGLTDKNGVEVYEGDIVRRVYEFTKAGKAKETIDRIVFRDDWGAFAFHGETSIGEGWERMYAGHAVYPFEVIGNIHENHELLKT